MQFSYQFAIIMLYFITIIKVERIFKEGSKCKRQG